MMAISTHGIGRTDIGVNSKPKADKKQEKAADAFASFMNLAAPQQSNDSSVKDKAVTEVATETVSGVIGSDSTANKKAEAASEQVDKTAANDTDDNVVSQTVKNDDSNVSDGTDKALSSEKADNSNVNEASDADGYGEVIDAALDDLKEAVMDLLGIDEEKFDELLATMGFSIFDLMKLENLNSFVLEAEGATNVDLLVNENLNTLMKNVENMLDNLTKEYDITDVELFISEAETVFADSAVTDMFEAAVQTEAEAKTGAVKEEGNGLPEAADYEADTNHESGVRVKVQMEQQTENQQSGGHETESFHMSEGQTGKGTDHIVSNLTQALNDIANADAVSGTEIFTDAVSEADIVRQIIDEIEVGITRESTSLELQLNPEHLGKVQINVSTRNGVMQAQIVTESEAARHAVEASIATLKEAFDNKELKVDAIEVMVGTSDFFNGNAEQQAGKENNQRTGNLNGSMQTGFMDEDEESASELEAEMMHVQGNTVSYMA